MNKGRIHTSTGTEADYQQSILYSYVGQNQWRNNWDEMMHMSTVLLLLIMNVCSCRTLFNIQEWGDELFICSDWAFSGGSITRSHRDLVMELIGTLMLKVHFTKKKKKYHPHRNSFFWWFKKEYFAKLQHFFSHLQSTWYKNSHICFSVARGDLGHDAAGQQEELLSHIIHQRLKESS